MTPAELCILFSSYVALFLLLWITDMAEKIEHSAQDTAGKTEHFVEEEIVASDTGGAYAWNVAAFFGIKERSGKKRSL